jgi:hypothetical protein
LLFILTMLYYLTVIKDSVLWQRWEDEQLRSEPLDYAKNLAIFEALLQYAREMGVFPPADPLEGIDVDVRVARIVNGLKAD